MNATEIIRSRRKGLTLRCIASFLTVFTSGDEGLMNENIDDALANVTPMQVVLFPFLQFEPSKHHIEQTAVLNVHT